MSDKKNDLEKLEEFGDEVFEFFKWNIIWVIIIGLGLVGFIVWAMATL